MRSARSKDTPRAGPPVSQVLGTPKRTSVRWPGRVFCKSKIWKGEKAAGGSHDSGGQGAGAPKISDSRSSANSPWQGGSRKAHPVKDCLPRSQWPPVRRKVM